MPSSYADGVYPIDFAIPTENLPAAAAAIRTAEPSKYEYHEAPEDVVADYLQDVIGGEIEADEDAVRICYLDMGNSSLGYDLEEGKARLNIIAPYLRPENPEQNPEPFLVLPWFIKMQRWTARDGKIVVEAVKVQYEVLETL